MSQTNSKNIIEAALRSIGVIASGEEARPDELQDALLLARQMIDGWSNNALLVHLNVLESFDLVEGQSEYLIGASMQFDTEAPVRITAAFIKAEHDREYPLKLISQSDWADEPYKNDLGEPRGIYYQLQTSESAHQYGIIRLNIKPHAYVKNLKLFSDKPINQLPDLYQPTIYPKGYERLIRLGLAIEIAPEYGVQIPQEIAATFQQAMSDIKSANAGREVKTLKSNDADFRCRGFDIGNFPR